MATYIVTTANDHLGDGSTVEELSTDGLSLREAVELANSNEGADTIVFDDTVFTGGTESLIRLTMGQIEIYDTLTIDGSSAMGVTITGDANGDDITVSGTAITDVAASFTGGAFSTGDLLDDNSRVFSVGEGGISATFDSLTITGGRSYDYDKGGGGFSGGGIYSLGDITLIETTVSGNSTNAVDARGGGVYSYGSVTMLDSTVSGNATSGDYATGGGLHVDSTLTLTNSTVSGNSTSGDTADGGGIYGATSITLTNSTVSGNSTAGYSSDGGGIYGGSTVTLTNSTISENSTSGDTAYGGGIYGATSITLTNSTVSGNRVDGLSASGGGLIGPAVTLINSTVSGNWAEGGEGSGVGGIHTDSLSLTNSIVLGNSTNGTPTPEVSGPATASGLNIVGTGDDTDGSDGIINADPTAVFAQTYANGSATAGVLADNGGPVWTIALKADITNPALDAVSSGLSTDARGVARDVDLPGVGESNTVDLGAFELQTLQPTSPQAFVVTTTDDELDFSGPDATIELMGGLGDLSIREAVFLANLAAETADTITFDATVFTGGDANLIRLTLGEIEITDALTIDGSGVDMVVITGDANGDDVLLEDSVITDVSASGAALLDDNSRVFNITSWDAAVTLDTLGITGGSAPPSTGGDFRVASSSAYGGGILSHTNSLTITNSVIAGNTASGQSEGAGGGISANALTVNNSIIAWNTAAGDYAYGGGILAAEVTVTNSIAGENSLSGLWAWGGGLSAGYATITKSTIMNNSAIGDYNSWGGGADASDLTLVNSTVSGNVASSASTAQAGGIGGYEVEIIHSTITGNSVDGGEASGSGVVGYYVWTSNSIVLGNDDGTTGSLELTAFYEQSASGLNIIGTGDDTDGSDHIINADPMAVFASTYANGAATAGVLADNDDSNIQTVALKLDASNPALDRATTDLATDARGLSRVDLFGIGNAGVDFADLGAFEARDNAPTVLSLANRLASIAEDRSTALRIKVADIDVTDPDGGTNTLSLAGADKALFEIFNGDLYLKAGAKLDFETNPKLDVTVEISADLNGPDVDRQATFSLKVTDVDEDPAGKRIVGTRDKDVLKGTDGDDTILGLASADRMIGGDGDDTFVYGSIKHAGPGFDGLLGNGFYAHQFGAGKRDVILDFDTNGDRFDFSAIDANTGRAGNQAFKFKGLGELDTAGSIIYRTFNAAGTANDKTIIYGDVDGDHFADFQIEITGIHKLTAGDFVL